MAKINLNAMNELMDGLTVTPEDTISPSDSGEKVSSKEVKPGKSVKATTKQKEKVCFNISIDSMEKVRTIAEKEKISITDILEAGISMAINNYEEKNGAIKVKGTKRGDVNKIFG